MFSTFLVKTTLERKSRIDYETINDIYLLEKKKKKKEKSRSFSLYILSNAFLKRPFANTLGIMSEFSSSCHLVRKVHNLYFGAMIF